ncbi:hypothetical protein P4475_14245 [Halalkalibacterium halodurans]|uniref:BH2768 protein n=1 Tax=Halalkalibacterium halodurans (strain ATCC BAA-125 / DSM 18197 / FERM 7344 / JCM 9153 / C-125) TaxID=272558 RepID=Q9K982_HALH5|nr:hypothetical protein [Halalkalibacterium halodurans]MED3647944.1 hypothetical protein [Halalkalibacterium halodurans]MED4122600.1 hypothetical protein [Halalkalibacterium halodurans]MED4161512.1 hypothetical protein [Halalkalibacterium halodurans]MED4172307.1 hypothetical protein [Halalkalibacterium halodurans]BAB06487.1 BH2768 [Halalkalibacterium halodurans C-125]
MIIVLFTLGFVAYGSYTLFEKLQWMVTNFKGDPIPYSLGAFIFYAFIAYVFFSPVQTPLLSFMPLLYVTAIWVLGILDDIFGTTYPKGLKGHFKQAFVTKKPTTGVLKAGGTFIITLAVVFAFQPTSLQEFVRYILLLLLIPHGMNLFDTRPLRVWKLAFLFIVAFLPVLFYLPFDVLLYFVTVFYIVFVMEGHKKAMLGDNGATTVGAIIALVVIFHTGVTQQWIIALLFTAVTFLAERTSFTSIIERHSLLRLLDQIGVSTQE